MVILQANSVVAKGLFREAPLEKLTLAYVSLTFGGFF